MTKTNHFTVARIEVAEVVEELGQITEEYEWWNVSWNIDRVEKLVEKINEMLKKEEQIKN